MDPDELGKSFSAPPSRLPAHLPAKEAFSAEREQILPSWTISLASHQLRLTLTIGNGLHCRLEHMPSGVILADGPYCYSFGNPLFTEVHPETGTVVLGGCTDTGIEVAHVFRAHADSDWIEEELTLTNRGATPLDLHAARCGFVLPVSLAERADDRTRSLQTFAAVPFLREPNETSEHQYAEYSLVQILTSEFASGLWIRRTCSPNEITITPHFAAEGWVWQHGTHTFLVTKYSQRGMEWSILDGTRSSADALALRWGGIGIHHGNPEHGARLLPAQAHRFGTTRITPIRGERKQGFYAFRAEMDGRGHICPPGFNPPVHWNELFDNKLWWLGNSSYDNVELKKQHFGLAEMQSEAAKAKEIGCEALYIDPGWDTVFGSKIWDESRFGSFKSFTALLANEYGLKCSLHTPMSGWSNPAAYPRESFRLDRFRKRVQESWSRDELWLFRTPICGASRQFIDETAARLRTLARDGAACFIFDGTTYHAECWDADHGHPIPARTEEHVQATMRLVRMIHEDFPSVLIEMHDAAMGPHYSRYVPIYYGHGAPQDGTERVHTGAGFDLIWAFELMWKPLEYLLNGQAISLYYYNLAYSIPLYLHIDLRSDNSNALAFWWNASTCRHLGIGGSPADPAVAAAHKSAMQTYMRLKPHFSAGVFYGIDEMTHFHLGPDKDSAVINCFNLQDHPVEREVFLDLAEFGLRKEKSYRVAGATLQRSGDTYRAKVAIPAMGHTLIELA